MTQIYNRAVSKSKRRLLRRTMPPAEAIVWNRLRNRQAGGLKFRRQYSVGPYVVDFYCPSQRFAIELDGDSHAHETAVAYDAQRQKYIESFGIRFLRFTNAQVYENLEGIIEFIERSVKFDLPRPLLTKEGSEIANYEAD